MQERLVLEAMVLGKVGVLQAEASGAKKGVGTKSAGGSVGAKSQAE